MNKLLAILLLTACSGSSLEQIPVETVADETQEIRDTSTKDDICSRACLRLYEVDCPEGKSPICEDVCRKIETVAPGQFNPACITRAGTRYQVRVCGTVKCIVKRDELWIL